MKNKKMSRKAKIITITAVIMIIVTAAFATALALLLKDNSEINKLYNQGKIRFVYNENIVGEYTLEEMQNMAAAIEFRAVYKPSGQTALERTYEGIELKALFAAMDISLEGKTIVKLTGADGYSVNYSVLDVKKEGNVFIAFKYENTPFIKGIAGVSPYPKEEGGPMVAIRAADPYSNYRVKTLTVIEV